MSVCGNCHYCAEFEAECDYGCTYEDAIYKEQAAYDSLMKRYEELEKKHAALERRHEECISQLFKTDISK